MSKWNQAHVTHRVMICVYAMYKTHLCPKCFFKVLFFFVGILTYTLRQRCDLVGPTRVTSQSQFVFHIKFQICRLRFLFGKYNLKIKKKEVIIIIFFSFFLACCKHRKGCSHYMQHIPAYYVMGICHTKFD